MMDGSSEITTPAPVRPTSASIQRLPFEPEMVSIPAGSFTMSCVAGRENTNGGCDIYDEQPAHIVNIKAFKIGKYEVTFDEWDACQDDNVCPHIEDLGGWGRVKRPVINVSWLHTQIYIRWLNKKTHKAYRLPTEAEWEYAARALSNTVYPWGDSLNCDLANFGGLLHLECQTDQTQPVGSYAANAFGLYDTVGNVAEWVHDWYAEDFYKFSPINSPKGPNIGSSHVVRGGAWGLSRTNARPADRDSGLPNSRNSFVGFRLALD